MPPPDDLPEPRYDLRAPCACCPYRRDAPLGKWHASHFIELAANDRNEFGPIYLCHCRDGNPCVGWVLDQRRRGLPNITLRIRAAYEPRLGDLIAEVTDGGHRTFPSIGAMCVANLRAIALMARKSRRRRQKDADV